MALADAWEHADRWPQPVAAALATDGDLTELELLLALPEHKVPLPGGAASSQTDLFVLARRSEASWSRSPWRARPRNRSARTPWPDGARTRASAEAERLAYLVDVLGLADDDAPRADPLPAVASNRVGHHRGAPLRRGPRRAARCTPSARPHGGSTTLPPSRRSMALPSPRARPCEPLSSARGPDDHVTLHIGWVSDTPATTRGHATPVGRRFDRAFAFARDLHARQVRKGHKIPYVAHLWAVASLVLEDGGSEDEAIAALLHDAVEDQGGARRSGRSAAVRPRRRSTSSRRARTPTRHPKPPWRERKEDYIAHLHDPELPPGTLRVSLADKLHNARAILFDLRAGHDVVQPLQRSARQQHLVLRRARDGVRRAHRQPDGGGAATRRRRA